MPAIDEYRAHLYRADYSLLILVALTLLCVGITIRLWRKWPRFRVLADALAPLSIPLVTLPIPVMAGVSFFAAFQSRLHPPRRFRLSLPLVLALAVILRLPIMFQSFWYDEAFTAHLTTLPLAKLWPAIVSDTHPPLFYTSIYLWSRIVGQSEFLLRIPSLVLGVASVYLLYRLTKALGLNDRVALVAALLCAVTPSAIYYATELRSYVALAVAVLGALVCLLEDRPKWFVVCVAACGWLHNLGLFYVPPLIVAAVLYLRNRIDLCMFEPKLSFIPANRWIFHEELDHVWHRPSLYRWLPYLVISALLSVVWLPLALQQSGAIADGFWIYFNAGTPFWTLILNLMHVPKDFLLSLLIPYVALIALSFWIARGWLRTAPGAALLIVLTGAPALTIAASVVWAPVYLPRIFLPVMLMALIPLAFALVTRWRIVAAVALPVLTLSLMVFYSTSTLIRPDYRTMMAEGCQGATALYTTAIDTAITVAPDWTGQSLAWAGGYDRGNTFLIDELPILDIPTGEVTQLAGQAVCLVYILTPRTVEVEREEVARLLATYPHTTREYPLHEELMVGVYVLDVKG